MKNTSRLIIILISIAVIAGGFFLFLFRHSITYNLSEKIELIPTISADQVKITPSEALDVSLLENESFKALVDNVVSFDFNNICYRPGSDQTVSNSAGAAGTGSESEETAAEKAARLQREARPKCVQGSATPFVTSAPSQK